MCNPEPKTLTLERAAQLAQLDADEICWAIEQHGQCDSDDFIILPCDGGDLYVVRPR
jgi:hypothetical protein